MKKIIILLSLLFTGVFLFADVWRSFEFDKYYSLHKDVSVTYTMKVDDAIYLTDEQKEQIEDKCNETVDYYFESFPKLITSPTPDTECLRYDFYVTDIKHYDGRFYRIILCSIIDLTSGYSGFYVVAYYSPGLLDNFFGTNINSSISGENKIKITGELTSINTISPQTWSESLIEYKAFINEYCQADFLTDEQEHYKMD